MEYGLIGERLGHSFSEIIHKEFGAYDYRLHEVSREGLEEFITARDFRGINVTIPYKTDVIPYLDTIDEAAEKIGAVNTVINRDGRLLGYNTDLAGLTALIKRVLARSGRSDLSGLTVLIAGTGGTSLTAIAAARSLKAENVIRMSRTGKDGATTYYRAEKRHSDAGFLINCTPCGMFPDDESIPVRLSRFTSLVGVVDVIYNPLRTRLVRAALKAGIPAEGGLYMLVSQAVSAYEIFTDKVAEEGLTDRIYEKLMHELENIVLIGMPSSGKTTVGKYISKKTGRELIDTDKLIVKNTSKDIKTIFSESGEPAFRQLEAETIRQISCGSSGKIIATGGGAVLNILNIERLKRNGRVYWLDRPLAALMPTSDRPVTSDRESLIRTYHYRYPKYRAYCDVRVSARKNVPTTAEKIISDFENHSLYSISLGNNNNITRRDGE